MGQCTCSRLLSVAGLFLLLRAYGDTVSPKHLTLQHILHRVGVTCITGCAVNQPAVEEVICAYISVGEMVRYKMYKEPGKRKEQHKPSTLYNHLLSVPCVSKYVMVTI